MLTALVPLTRPSVPNARLVEAGLARCGAWYPIQWIAGQLPLSTDGCAVTGALQHFCNGCRLRVEMPERLVIAEAVATGQEAHTRWRAKRSRVRVFEAHTLPRQTVDTRGLVAPTVRADGFDAGVIGEDDDHVRARAGLSGGHIVDRGAK